MRELVFEALSEALLYAIACGIAVLAVLGLAYYPRTTGVVLAGIGGFAVFGIATLLRSQRTGEPAPKGRLVVAAMIALGLVVLVLAYALPNGCLCLR